MKALFSIFMSFALVWGLEYKFKQIASIPHGTAADEPFFIGDTDNDGLNEIIFWTHSFDHHKRHTSPLEIWEYRLGNFYEREYISPDGMYFLPYAVGDIDKDGLSDIIGSAAYGQFGGDSFKIIMLESPDPFSHPTEIVWEVRYYPHPESSNYLWWGRPLIADIDKDGKNEYIIPFINIYIAKCIGNNKIELVDSIPLETGKHVMDWSSILGDFDQDGKVEIVSGGEGGWDWQLEVYENTTDYKFKNVFRDSVPPYRGNAKVFSSQDSDGDGKPEIFLPYGRPTGYYKGVIYLYRWETTGDNSYFRILVDSARTDSGIPWSRSCCGDVDGDGIDEIVWSLGTDVYVYKSTGNDKYTRVWHWTLPFYRPLDLIYTQVKVYDMNKNGYGEIIISFDVSSIGDSIQIFEIDTTLSIIEKSFNPLTPQLTISPNPARRIVNIKYQVVSKEPITIKVYDASGRLVKTFVRAQKVEAGTCLIKWNGKDNKGLPLPSGVYSLKLETRNSPPLLRKIVLKR